MQRLTKSYHRVYCCGLINHWLIVVEQFLPGIPSLNRLQSNNNNNTHNNRDLEIGGQNSLESLWVLTSWPWLSVCLQKCTLSLVSLFKLPNYWAIWAKSPPSGYTKYMIMLFTISLKQTNLAVFVIFENDDDQWW